MNWLDECKKAADELPAVKKQEFLDMMHSGETLGDARVACGISFDAANGIMRANIESHQYSTLRKIAA